MRFNPINKRIEKLKANSLLKAKYIENTIPIINGINSLKSGVLFQ
tara:strand:+ start:40 stop:174 length:135 start_codon:yes stop_codon:yes gene_type:complete